MTLRLNIHGRSCLLFFGEIVANAVLWIAAGLVFGIHKDTQPILSLALLAWTLGLRHALDADHISAIDNATRGLIGMGQLPVTCGLFFSLGHSTIVVVVIIAIAISTSVYDYLTDVGSVGSIIGPAVSGSFLFIVGLANSVILYRTIKARRTRSNEAVDTNPKHNHTLLMRVIGPVITFVDRPWKMFPVGLLFGLGFDTASSISLLAIAALARGTDPSEGKVRQPADIVILPLLFTAGMTLVDSVDSILMLYSYSNFPKVTDSKFGWKFFLETPPSSNRSSMLALPSPGAEEVEPRRDTSGAEPGKHHLHNVDISVEDGLPPRSPTVPEASARSMERAEVLNAAKLDAMSNLSILLTVMSILAAFSISIITLMGLIGEQCKPCSEAAENDPGLAGRWWRAWASANEQSGFIGVGIIGSFLVVVSGWYAGKWWWRKREARRRVQAA